MSGQIQQTQAGQPALMHNVYDTFEKTAHLKDAWNDLADRAGDILCSFDWCEVWWQHFGQGRQLEIHTLHDGGRLVAVLPLFRETIRPGWVWLRTVRVVGCDYTVTAVGLAIEPAYAERFTGMVLDRLGQGGAWDMLEMAPLRSYAAVVEPMAQSCAKDSHVQAAIIGRHDGWDTLFQLPDTYEEFLASLPSSARNDTARRERRLREQYKVEFSTVTRAEQVQPAMDALIELHQKHWMDKGRPGHFVRLSVQQFHRDLAQRLLERGQLALLTLKANGRIVAATYGYSFGQRTHNLIVGNCHDRPWQRYGLGKIMYDHLFRHAMAQGSHVLEDGRGIFEHKLNLGGKLYGGRSLVVICRGWSTRLRFWMALRTAYAIHLLYSRIWLDTIAPRLRILPMERPFYLRHRVLAQLFRRTRFRLFGGPVLQETRCLESPPPGSLGKPPTAAPASVPHNPRRDEGPGGKPVPFLRRVLTRHLLLQSALICPSALS